MKRIGTLLSIILMACIPLAAFAGTEMSIVFNGPAGISFTADYNGTPLESSGGELHFEAAGEGYIEIQSIIGTTNHSLYRLTVNGSSEFTDVEWKPDANSEYQALNSSVYALSLGNARIDFFTAEMILGTFENHNDNFVVFALDLTTNTSEAMDLGLSAVLPGHYMAYLRESQAYVRFVVKDDQSFGTDIYWKTGETTPPSWQALHKECIENTGTRLKLLAPEFSLEIPALNTQSVYIVGSQTDPSLNFQVSTNEMTYVKLFPGTHELLVTQIDPVTSSEVAIAKVRCKVLNETNRLHNEITWIDLVGSRTSGTWATLQPGIAYLTPLKLAFSFKPPFDITGTSTLPYAVLKDKLDQGYYLAQDGVLRLRYDERYDETSALDLRILDMGHQEITLSSPVSRQYGTNWIELTLPSSGFTVGDFYVLEVRSEKGDLGRLRFRYDN